MKPLKPNVAVKFAICILVTLTAEALSGLASRAQNGSHEAGPVSLQTLKSSKASVLTNAQAIEIARKFCSDVGFPATTKGSAVYPAPNQFPGQQDTFWLPVWRVTFAGEAEVEVVDSTGAVSTYFNSDLETKLVHANRPAETPLPSSAAVRHAEVVIAAIGLTESLAPPVAGYITYTPNNPTTATAEWYLVYRRLYNGIPYRDQQINITLQAQSGSLISLGVIFRSPPPTNSQAKFSSEQAITVAKAQIDKAELTKARFTSCKLQVVQPNDNWRTGKDGPTTQPGVSRIAWDCVYQAAPVTYDVWIDTETGGIIGGEFNQPL